MKLNVLPCQFIIIPEDMMFKAGLREAASCDCTVHLFARPRFRQQVNLIRDDVVRCGKIGRIYGQPGTGKSSATLYVSIQLVMEYGWDVLWAHVTSGSLDCLRMKPDGTMATACIRADDFGRFLDRLHEFGGSKGQLLVIDGVTTEDETRLQSAGVHWVLSGRGRRGSRRLIVVSSHGKFKRLNGQARQRNLERIFIQWSWTEQDYEMAVAYHEFEESVGAFMDAERLPPDGLMWRAKYYYAGGSARFMFTMTTAQVIDELKDAVEEQVMAIAKCKSNGPFEMGSVNGLFSIFANQKYEIVSKYAQRLVLRELGSKEILKLAEHPLLKRE